MTSKPETEGQSNSIIRRWILNERKGKRGEGTRKPSFGEPRTSQDGEIPFESARSQRSQFLRLFGRRSSISPRTSFDSLSDDATRSKPALPTLPPEVWAHILHLAASPSHPFLSSSVITPTTSISFLEYPHSHTHLIPAYRASMRFKAQLTLVSRLWHSIGQAVLFEFVWITKASEAELLAQILSDKALRGYDDSTSASIPALSSSKRKGKQASRQPVETRRARISDETNYEYDRNGGFTYPYDTRGVGRHVRRLHIETATLDRCSPSALLTILEHAPMLQIFSDYRSIRRNATLEIHPPDPKQASNQSPSSSTTTSSSTRIVSVVDEQANHQVLSKLLAHPNRTTSLRRLSWTNYEYRPGDYDGVVRFYLLVVGPKLQMASNHLDFLELTLCAKDLGAGSSFLDNILNARPTADTTAVSTATSFESPTLHLPALRSLKVTLDNATFHVLSTWDMPALRHLSVVSADFSYAGEGFAQFFTVHGDKIRQLEIGHSSGAIEEFWLTSNHHHHHHLHLQQQQQQQQQNPGGWSFGSTRVSLAEWCPNLEQFICSADAEWDWQNPDWIAPHILLPSHPTLKFIGIRDLEKRIIEGLDRVEDRDAEALVSGGGLHGIDEALTGAVDGDHVFFMLIQQFGSILNARAFPGLLYVRDLSWESAAMRVGGRVRLAEGAKVVRRRGGDGGVGSARARGGSNVQHVLSSSSNAPLASFLHSLMRAPAHPTFNQPSTPSAATVQDDAPYLSDADLHRRREFQQGRRVLRLWTKISRLCKERGVYLEDCDGMSVTRTRLMQAAQQVRFAER